MQCAHAQEFFSDYITGAMDRALSVPLENHLESCDGCRETMADLRSLWTTLDALPVVEPPASFHASLMEKIGAEQDRLERPLVVHRPRFDWRTLFQPRSLGYAAAAVILCLGIRVAQVEMSGLGSFDMVFPWMKTRASNQVVGLSQSSASWSSGQQAGGTLTVTLQAKPQENGGLNALHYRVKVINVASQSSVAVREGVVFSNHPVAVAVPLDFTPTDTSHQVTVEVSPSETPGLHSRNSVLPVENVR